MSQSRKLAPTNADTKNNAFGNQGQNYNPYKSALTAERRVEAEDEKL